jgi:hypothetical protein
MSLWSEMLESASRAHSGRQPQPAALALRAYPLADDGAEHGGLGPVVTFWAPFADWSVWSRAPFPSWSGWLPLVPSTIERAMPNGAAQRAADDGGFRQLQVRRRSRVDAGHHRLLTPI